MGLVGDRLESIVGKFQADIVELELFLILLDERVLGLGQDRDQRVLIKLLKRADDRQAADEFGDQAVVDQVLGLEIVDRLVVPLLVGLDVGLETERLVAKALLDDLFKPDERTAADEQDVASCRAAENPAADACGRRPAGMFATVPSRIFSKACWTPSPETSRVIDGLSSLRQILSISSM